MRAPQLQKVGAHGTGAKLLIREHAGQQRPVGRHPRELHLVQGAVQKINGRGTRFAPGDDFSQHGIVIRRNLIARFDPGIQAQARDAFGPAQMSDLPYARQVVARRILRVQTCFDRVAAPGDLCLGSRHRLALRNAQLPFDQIDAGNEFRDRMLHLQAGIHFHEVEILSIVHQKFHGARTNVTHRLGGFDGGLRHRRTHFGAQARRRRFFDDLLMPALHRTVAIEQTQSLSVRVGKDLHFHVPGLGKVALHEQAIIAKGGARQTLRRFHRSGYLGGGIDHLHAFAAASRARLDDQRKSDARRLGGQTLRRLLIAVIARRHRHADGRHGRL